MYIQRLEKQLRDIGLYVNFIPTDGVYLSSKHSDALLASYGAVASFVDPLTNFANYIPGIASKNHTVADDPVGVALFHKADGLVDRIKRQAAIVELSKHFKEQYRTLPLEEIYQGYSYGSRVKSLNLGKGLVTIDFTKVQVQLNEK